MARRFSPWDYSLTISRKNRYWVVCCVEFNLRFSIGALAPAGLPELISTSSSLAESSSEDVSPQSHLDTSSNSSQTSTMVAAFPSGVGVLPEGTPLYREVGETVARAVRVIEGRLRELDLRGEPHPVPLKLDRFARGGALPLREAARVLGMPRTALRKLAYRGAIRFERSPGGHLRFPFDALHDYLLNAA